MTNSTHIKGETVLEKDTIKNIRAFNRYYTVWLDVISKSYLGTGFSWPESRVLFEIYISDDISATELCEHLNMDKSYVSRILAKLEKNKLITRELVVGSKGTKKLHLTELGIKEAKQIDKNGDTQIVQKLKTMDTETCEKLCKAMMLIEKILRENDNKTTNSEDEICM